MTSICLKISLSTIASCLAFNFYRQRSRAEKRQTLRNKRQTARYIDAPWERKENFKVLNGDKIEIDKARKQINHSEYAKLDLSLT